jgi:acetyltransferase-like isoleucine patch superfamily enzyme
MMPGATTFRIWCHRMRRIRIGTGVFIGYDVILETEYPECIWIGNGVEINMRATLIGHFHGIEIKSKGPGLDKISIKLEDNAFIGPGVIVLPNVVIGQGAAVAAGSVVTKNVPPMTFVQGNPAVPVAKLGIPLAGPGTYKEFLKMLKPYKP